MQACENLLPVAVWRHSQDHRRGAVFDDPVYVQHVFGIHLPAPDEIVVAQRSAYDDYLVLAKQVPEFLKRFREQG